MAGLGGRPMFGAGNQASHGATKQLWFSARGKFSAFSRAERVGRRPLDAPGFETWLHNLPAGRGRPGPTKISRAGKIRNRSRRSREARRRIRNQLCLPRKEGNLDSEVSARSLLTGRQAIKVVPMQTGARCVPRR